MPRRRIPARNLARRLLVAATLLGALHGCTASSGDAAPSPSGPAVQAQGSVAPSCPSMVLPPPRVLIELQPPITRDTTLDLELTIDGKAETCALVVSDVAPSKTVGELVAGPTTRVQLDCPSLEVYGLRTDGGLGQLQTKGKPNALRLRVLRAGVELGTLAAEPIAYAAAEPHGAGCGSIEQAEYTIELGG